ncbi:MAG: MoaD/ThiS family protein [Gemmataceae bacterium]
MNVLLFARARDLVGSGCVEVPLAPGATVSDLRSALATAYPALKPLLAHSGIAIGEE